MRSKFLDIPAAILAVVAIALFAALIFFGPQEKRPSQFELKKRAKVQRIRTAYDLCEDGSRAECTLLQSFCTNAHDEFTCTGLYPARSQRSAP